MKQKRVCKLNQNKMPIVEMLQQFRNDNKAYFNIPAHHFERGASVEGLKTLGKNVYALDVTETVGTDDLHHPEEKILEAQKLAADLYGADESWFLVNGTTCGNEAMILSVAGPGESIIVDRNAHKSALMGLVLCGANPIWIEPFEVKDVKGEYSQKCLITSNMVKEAIIENPDAKAVFLTSPTYYGICQPLKDIVRVCHEYKIPLLVDEAHGGHLAFHDQLPDDAISCGADLVSQSTHKTSGSLTQTSMLHLKSDLIDRQRVDQSLKLVQSTSPSYILMTSLDIARHQMATRGEALIEDALLKVKYFYEHVKDIAGIEFFEMDCKLVEKDPLRMVISANRLGLSGFQLENELARFGITVELADPLAVLAIITWGTSYEELDLLINALERIAKEKKKLDIDKKDKGHCIKLSCKNNLRQKSVIPHKELSPREAWFAKKKRVSLDEAAGCIAASMIVPYPPGVPFILPGELITKEMIDHIKNLIDAGASFHGFDDVNEPMIAICRQ